MMAVLSMEVILGRFDVYWQLDGRRKTAGNFAAAADHL